MNAQKHFRRLAVALALAALLAPAAAHAALDSDSATITASASLIRTLTIEPLNNLNFGTLIKGSLPLLLPVAVVLDPLNDLPPSLTSSNPGAVMSAGGFTDGTFHILGEPGALVQASYPASIVIKKGAGGSAATEMTIDNFNVDVYQTGGGANVFGDATKQFTMPASGDARLEVGGRLTVEDTDEYGTYAGTFTVTVTYL
jgi:spore coat protein U-like protein